VFCIHGGRVGSAYLAKLLSGYPNVTAVHEETFVGKGHSSILYYILY
jgi:hypothetical protein